MIVARLFSSAQPLWWRKGCRFLLAFAWLGGLAAGGWTYCLVQDRFCALMRRVLYAPVSIVGLTCVCTLPFLLSALAVFCSRPRWLLGICFGRAFVTAFYSVGLLLALGSAGWLARWLVLFADMLSAPALYCFWLRHISGERPLGLGSTAPALGALLLVGGVDYCLIAPFLAEVVIIQGSIPGWGGLP